MDKLKNSWKSWTIWFNGVSATVILGLPQAVDAIPQLEQYVSHQVYQIIGSIVVGANILLRFKTNKPLDEK